MILESLASMIKNDLDNLKYLEQELAEHGLFPLQDAEKLTESVFKVAAISVLRDIYDTSDHIVRLVLREIDQATDLDIDDTFTLAMLKIDGVRPSLISKDTYQFIKWLVFFMENVDEKGRLFTKTEDVHEILTMLPDFYADITRDVKDFLATLADMPEGSRDLLLRCECCDDLILTRHTVHGARKCQCGRIAVDVSPEGLLITYNSESDADNSVYIIDLAQMKKEISYLDSKSSLSDEEKQRYYELALTLGIDNILKKLDIMDIQRLLPHLKLPKIIKEMWHGYING